MGEQNLTYDIDGYDVLTNALVDLVNLFPGLDKGDAIRFTFLDADGGKAFFASSGAVVMSKRESITGHVEQECSYPFSVIYRASGLSETRRARVKEWLDTLGRWLERQPVSIAGTEHKLTEYPALTGTRQFKEIARTTPAFLYEVHDNQAEDWMISIDARYKNEFYR